MSSRSYTFVRASRVALMSATMLAGAAHAQNASPAAPTTLASAAPAAAAPEGEIVVTGSRVAVAGFSAPTPTQVIGADVIATQAQATVAAVLYQNPAFKATRSASGNSVNTSNPGQATADLRGLGGQRTLVLINGSRIVPNAPSNNLGVPVATDLNLIPTQMIDRVEVVTGGTVAQYGSDAVSGVVGIVLKKKVQGIEAIGSYGVSGEGDNDTWRLGAIGGTSFAEGRGNIVISGDYSNSKGFRDFYSRDWGRRNYGVLQRTGVQPTLFVSENVVDSVGVGGIITGATRSSGTGLVNGAGQSLLRYTFNSDGTMRPHDDGSQTTGTVQIGGEGINISQGLSVIPAVNRFTTYGRLQYEFSDAATVYLEGGYAHSHGELYGNPARFASGTALTINRANPFIPAALRTALNLSANTAVTAVTMSRLGTDVGNIHFNVFNSSPHGTLGVEGDLGNSWHYDAHYSYGENHYKNVSESNPITARTAFATDVVAYNPATNQIFDFAGGATTPPAGYVAQCRALVPGSSTYNPTAAAGCTPANWFGNGNLSQGALSYLRGSGVSKTNYTQSAGGANVRGEPFSTWAGPVGVAFGGEFRRESQTTTADAIGAANGFTSAGNAAPFSAHFDVQEGYIEALVPLVKDSFVYSAELNGAVRYAHYSTVGGQTAWNLRAGVEAIKGLRFRGTLSRDIRAPALFELYSPGSDVTNTINQARNLNTNTVIPGTPSIPQNVNIGNSGLNAERAKTWTLGVVGEPQGGPLRGLRVSIDYFNINIKGAIVNLSATNIVTLCNAELAQGIKTGQFCGYLNYNTTTGLPTALRSPTLNLGSFHNIGTDFQLSYTHALGAGRINVTAAGTYTQHAYVDTGVPLAAGGVGPIDRAGEMGQNNTGAVPTFRGNLSVGYRTDGWSLTGQALYISSGTNDNTYNSTVPGAVTINENTVPEVWYFNLYGSVKVMKNIELLGRIDNVLDRDPPALPYSTLLQPVNGVYYDKIGRSFQIGVNVKF